ncbi:hypothetical protein AXI58_13970 [Bacillus nakamurai]|uniref:Uncharacterized protein n=1 Tax=Bacillus nakamurai TaxID=1793963 RepID=A0A150F7Z0_9BACI|nr:hypothetical protein AXI58_13970 [Bacillus nakamurai]
MLVLFYQFTINRLVSIDDISIFLIVILFQTNVNILSKIDFMKSNFHKKRLFFCHDYKVSKYLLIKKQSYIPHIVS